MEERTYINGISKAAPQSDTLNIFCTVYLKDPLSSFKAFLRVPHYEDAFKFLAAKGLITGTFDFKTWLKEGSSGTTLENSKTAKGKALADNLKGKSPEEIERIFFGE
jgi:hypothetical protein